MKIVHFWVSVMQNLPFSCLSDRYILSCQGMQERSPCHGFVQEDSL